MKLREKILNGKARVRGLGRRLGGRAVILLYHRVSGSSPNPQLLKVTPGHFQEHLDVLKDRGCEPLRIPDLPGALKARAWDDPPAFAVTFDDGYPDNLTVAAPALERSRVPATVYVATSALAGSREPVRDILEMVLLSGLRLPDRLALEINGRQREWIVNEATTGGAEGNSWNVLQPPRTGAERAYLDLSRIIREMKPAGRADLLSALRTWAGVSAPARDENRTLTGAELTRLAANPWIDIGAHTVNHPMLSALNREEQRYEILESKRTLESLLNRRIYSFAYPYGRVEDYSDASVAIVRKAGFGNACSNFPAVVHRFTAPYQLPRICVYDWDGAEFARRLDAVLNP